MSKPTDFPAVTTPPANAKLVVVDPDDPTDDAAGSDKILALADAILKLATTDLSATGTPTAGDTVQTVLGKLANGSVDLAGFLPLSAGATKELTDSLYVKNNTLAIRSPDRAAGVVFNDGFPFFQEHTGVWAGLYGNILRLRNDVALGFSSGTVWNNAVDVQLRRDDAGVFAMRNGANAHALRVYGNYTDASNYERLSLSADGAGNVTIAAETLGDGTDDVAINLTPAGNGNIIMGSLPTSDPTVAGALWNDSGTLKVSAG